MKWRFIVLELWGDRWTETSRHLTFTAANARAKESARQGSDWVQVVAVGDNEDEDRFCFARYAYGTRVSKPETAASVKKTLRDVERKLPAWAS